jgi:hypothetical protein
MKIVAQFDPSAKTSDSFNTNLPNGTGKIVIYNESNISLQLTFPSGETAYAPAWMAVLYCVQLSNPNVKWNQLYTLSSLGPPLSVVIVETYNSNEPVPGTFPASLVRAVNIGNAVSTVGGGSSFVQNDGNTAGTSVVESTVSGDGASAVSLTNAGDLHLGTVAHHGSITTIGPLSTDNAQIVSDGAGVFTIVNRILTNLIKTITGNDLTLGVETGHKIALQVNNADVVDVNSSGINILSGGLLLPSSQLLKGISHFGPYTVTSTPTAFNHNLGITPTLCVICVANAAAADIDYDRSTMTSTQVTMSSTASCTVTGIALAF